MDFADRLRRIREGRRFSQEDLAKRIGVSPATVSQWERGTPRPGRHTVPLPDLEQAHALAVVLGVPLSALAEDWPDSTDWELLHQCHRLIRSLGPDEAFQRLTLSKPPGDGHRR